MAELIRRAVDTVPDAPAVITPGGTLTYRELGERAGRLAGELGRVVGPGGFVGIDGTRGAGAIVAMVAALWAGPPFVVVDPRDSGSSTAAKLSALGVGAMLTHAAATRPGDVEVEVRPARGADRLAGIEEQIAYAVFTSGSTSEPKCVLVAADPLAPMVADHVRVLEVGPGCRTLQFARLTFDGCITEILWTLTSGAGLVVVGEDGLIPGTELAATLATYRVTHLKTTPFALTETRPPADSSLRHVVNGGGPCRQAVVERWSAVAAFHNAYGLTETTVCNLLTPPLDPAACRDGVPLGDVVGDCECELDAADGGRGELVVRGRSVSIGYLTDTGVARFRDAAGRPVYRTGDIVERRGGELHYVERADRRLKVRGYRIDPGEVEVAACRLPSVREAVVLAEDDMLSCYYVGDVDPREVREHLGSVVERYKVPSVVQRVERMPYTPNGKVDRDALRSGRARAAGSTPREQVLRLVGELTGVEDVSAQDNFFEIGGDSATTLLLVGKLQELGWADAAVRDVLRAENLGALVDRVPAGTG